MLNARIMGEILRAIAFAVAIVATVCAFWSFIVLWLVPKLFTFVVTSPAAALLWMLPVLAVLVFLETRPAPCPRK